MDADGENVPTWLLMDFLEQTDYGADNCGK